MSDDTPVPLDHKALQALIAPTPPPAVDLTRPAFGDVRVPGEESSPLAEREQGAYRWTRENYLNFIDKVRSVDLDGPIAVSELREYIMRQLVALSGHPDPKTAIKALELLGKVKNVNLFEEKRASGGADAADAAAVRAALTAAAGLLKGLR